jgi:hypothetical protein
VDTGSWQGELAGRRLLVSGFGKWGGGAYDLTSGVAEALDDLPTSGLAVGGGRLWRVLRAPGEHTSVGELLSYDERGVRSYQRLDAVRDPHDVLWHDGAPHVASSWDDTVWRVEGDRAVPVWRAGSPAPDAWHVNALATGRRGSLLACAFGTTDRHKGWKADEQPGTGILLDLRAGRAVLSGLVRPHSPRPLGDGWLVCESSLGWLTEFDARGYPRRRVEVGRFTRGLAVLGRWALVGGNAHRSREDDRGEVAVVDLATMTVVDRLPLPCTEAYDIVAVPAPLAGGLATGFGANPSRAVDQHRAAIRAAECRSAPPPARVQLATPRVAAALARAGDALHPDDAEACGVRSAGATVARMPAGSAGMLRVEVVNGAPVALATVPPRPVRVAVRWLRRTAAGTSDEEVTTVLVNQPVPLPHVVPPGGRVLVDVPVEAPAEPGAYELRVALRQPGPGWFGAGLHAEVAVTPPERPERPPPPRG